MNQFITTTKTQTKRKAASNTPMFKKMDKTVNSFFDDAFKMTSKWKGNK